MFDFRTTAELSRTAPPLLAIVVDTEEEFDWNAPLSRDNTGVSSVAAQEIAQAVLRRHRAPATYLVDWCVASDRDAVRALARLRDADGCEIGAHCHPWVNPPFEEEVNARNSYPGNLPEALEREKIGRLTDLVAQAFGEAPRAYKAGRYGAGAATARILEDLGYDVDASVVPRTSFARDGGPDYVHFDERPFWFGSRRRLLEVPTTRGLAGPLAGFRAGASLHAFAVRPLGRRLRAPGILRRAGLVERIALTPEGGSLAEAMRLTASLLVRGCRVMTLAYHSTSLVPGDTPYVHTPQDLTAFLSFLDAYLDHFASLGGCFATLSGIRAALAAEERRADLRARAAQTSSSRPAVARISR